MTEKNEDGALIDIPDDEASQLALDFVVKTDDDGKEIIEEVKAEGAETETETDKDDAETPPSDPVEDLKKQLAALEAKSAAEAKARTEAEQRAQAAEGKYVQAQADTLNSRFQAVLTAINATQKAADGLEQQMEAALNEGDNARVVKIQREMAKAETRLAQLEEGKAAFESEFERLKAEAAKPKPEPKAPEADPVETYIGKFTPESQAYLREHRDYVTNKDLNAKLIRGHHAALGSGLEPDTKEYFDYLDSHMMPKSDPAPQPRKRSPHAAPVSRETTTSTGRPTGNKVHLTAEQVQTAKDLGMTPARYAQWVVKMKSPDWDGPKMGQGN